MTALFNADRFAEREGETFQVSSPTLPSPLTLTLVSVKAWGENSFADGRCFTLLFHGPGEPLLPQSIYHFDDSAMGDFEIFIVPIGPDGANMRYEAVFS